MNSKQRKTIEEQFYNYKSNNNYLWKCVFSRTLIICESALCDGKQLDELMRLLYIDHKKPYNVWSALGISENYFYKKKREIKRIAFKEAKRLHVL